eukprot:4654722-Prymnesium_polylepis.1
MAWRAPQHVAQLASVQRLPLPAAHDITDLHAGALRRRMRSHDAHPVEIVKLNAEAGLVAHVDRQHHQRCQLPRRCLVPRVPGRLHLLPRRQRLRSARGPGSAARATCCLEHASERVDRACSPPRGGLALRATRGVGGCEAAREARLRVGDLCAV